MAQAKQNDNGVRAARQLPPGFVPATLILLCLIGAYIRVSGAGGYHYNADEVLLLDIAQGKTLSDVLSLSQLEAHPPLGNALYHYWFLISDTPAFARAESLLFGLLLIPLYFRIGKTLDGELAGIFSAGLITFGNGCIAESYIVRNYTLFLLLLSLGFYYYLLWRKARGTETLPGYAFFFSAAVMVHFSALFALAALFLGEAVFLIRRRAAFSKFVYWGAANFLPLAIGAVAYYAWQSSLQAAHDTLLPPGWRPGAAEILFYPVFLFRYLLPGRMTGLYPLVSFLLALALFIWAAVFRKAMRPLLALMVISLLLGMGLLAVTLYPYAGTRHVLWALPFVIAPAGWALAELCTELAHWLPGYNLSQASGMLAGQFIFILACLYSPEDRFADRLEYPMPEAEWQALDRYMSGLDGSHLIVAGKSDMFQLDPPGINPYDFMGDNPVTGKSRATLLPYYHTHILFNPYGYRLRESAVLLHTMEEANQRHLLDGADTLVLVNTAWQSDAIIDLMLCPALQKNVITFPKAEPGHRYTYDELKTLPASLLIVATKVFLKDVLSPAGKARECFAVHHD